MFVIHVCRHIYLLNKELGYINLYYVGFGLVRMCDYIRLV